jgi:hypothetical protein
MLASSNTLRHTVIDRARLECQVTRVWYVKENCFVLNIVIPCAEENQLDATQWFIDLVIISTCFGHLYAHRQELETSGVPRGGSPTPPKF